MQRRQAFVFELMPDGRQRRLMAQFCGACRFVFNQALALQKERYEQGEKRLGYAGLCQQLTAWRHSPETPWLKDAPIHPLQQALKDLERAYGNFFARRAGFPNFRKKGRSERFRYPDPKQIRLDEGNGRLFLPKLGWLRYRKSRDVQGAVRNVTVSQRCGKWLVSIQTEREVEHEGEGPARSVLSADAPPDAAVGIDRSIRQHCERQRLQRIAGQDRGGLVEGDVHGGLAAAQGVVVHRRQVVMHQRIAVDQFDRGGGGIELRVGRAERIAGGMDEQGPHALAAVEHAMAHRGVQARGRGRGVGQAAVERGFDARAPGRERGLRHLRWRRTGAPRPDCPGR